MGKLNILNREGMLTDEERKQPFTHGCQYMVFETCLDLSCGVKIIPYGTTKQLSVDQYSQDLASFIAYWTLMVRKSLNGFSGMSHVKFDLNGIELVDTNKPKEIVKPVIDAEKIHYLEVDLENHSEYKESTKDEIDSIIDDEDSFHDFGYELCEDGTIELDGSLDKHDGKFLSGGLLKHDMPFLLKFVYGKERYFKCTLDRERESEDRHWISYMYKPTNLVEITKEEFDSLKHDQEFTKMY